EDGIRAFHVTGVQTCALPIWFESVGASGGAVDRPPDQGIIARPVGGQREIEVGEGEARVDGEASWRCSTAPEKSPPLNASNPVRDRKSVGEGEGVRRGGRGPR